VLTICFTSLLSACDLVTINNQKYLAQVVAETDGVKITMEDLILGYNSFGYDYVQNQNYTAEEAVKKTLEDLIDRELLINKAKSVLGNLTITEQNEVRKEVYDYINSQIKTYADSIIKSDNLVVPSVADEEETETTTSFTPFEKTVVREYANGSYEYKRVYEDRKDTDTKLIEFSLNEYGIEGLAARAYSKYINNVKKSRDEYKNLSNDEVFEKEFTRIYKIYEKNKILTLFQEKIENEMPVDLENVVAKYIELVKNSAFTYALDESGYNSKMQNSANEVYYQPFGEKYIQVAHILIGYSTEQNNEITKLKSKLDAGYINIDDYNAEIDKLAQKLKTENNLDQLFEEIKTSVNSASTKEAKIAKFIEYIEQYNTDPGMLTAINNQTQYYTINLDTTVTDTMVKPFAEASRSLYSLDGSLDYTIYFEPVLSEYGYHIIFSVGAVKNDINLQNIENVTINYLYETEAMLGTNKSLFDKVLEIVDKSNYSEYQSSLIKGLRDNLTIKYNKTAYERLYK